VLDRQRRKVGVGPRVARRAERLEQGWRIAGRAACFSEKALKGVRASRVGSLTQFQGRPKAAGSRLRAS
jgi:hypothetical protein